MPLPVQKPQQPLRKKRKAFTLLEVMVGISLFTVVMLATSLTLAQAFRLLARARYRDRAINVLKSVVDQFQEGKVKRVTVDPANPGAVDFLQFFKPTTGAGFDNTRHSMAWDLRVQAFMLAESTTGAEAGGWRQNVDFVLDTDNQSIRFPLNTIVDTADFADNDVRGRKQSQAPIATLTRTVRYINPANGLPVAAPTGNAQGILIQGVFTLSYTFLNAAPTTLTATAVRNLSTNDK